LPPASTGTISPEELKHILEHFGEPMDAAEVDEYIAEADVKCPDLKANGDKTGLINYCAFVGVMLDLTEDEVMAAGLGGGRI
jgi:Ca2+-binding EF-hand superfamily protein